MRTTLDLPDELFRELKSQAARRSLKLKELIAIYVDAGLHGHAVMLPGGQPIKRSPLPIARRSTGLKIPSLTNAQIEARFDQEKTHAKD